MIEPGGHVTSCEYETKIMHVHVNELTKKNFRPRVFKFIIQRKVEICNTNSPQKTEHNVKTVLFYMGIDECNPPQCQDEVRGDDDDEGGHGCWNGKVCERWIVGCLDKKRYALRRDGRFY